MYKIQDIDKQKELRRKENLLYYYNIKENKTTNDFRKIEELKQEIKEIRAKNKITLKSNILAHELNKLKNKWENQEITRFDIEDILFCMEMQRKTENMIQCINTFLASR